MVAILVKWPKINIIFLLFFLYLIELYSIWNLFSNSPMISEKGMQLSKMSGLWWKVSLTFGAVTLGLTFPASIMIST